MAKTIISAGTGQHVADPLNNRQQPRQIAGIGAYNCCLEANRFLMDFCMVLVNGTNIPLHESGITLIAWYSMRVRPQVVCE